MRAHQTVRVRGGPASPGASRAEPARTRPNGAARSNQMLLRRPQVGRVVDPLEREADRAADRALGESQAEPFAAAAAQPNGVHAGRAVEEDLTLRRQPEEEEEEEELLAKAEPGGPVAAGTEAAASAVAEGGKPLSGDLRAYFEPRFARDLSGVRIHDSSEAHAAAKQINARAYTLGTDIAFGTGQFDPASRRGRWLIAHELAHVAQAPACAGPSPQPALEREAESAATTVVAGGRPNLAERRDERRPALFGEPQHVPEVTYVAGQDPRNDGFLNDAIQYHRAWRLRPRNVDSLEDVVDHLQGGRGDIGRIRIVTHASQTNLFTALFEGGAPGIQEAELRAVSEGPAAAVEQAIGGNLLTDQTYTNILDHLRQTNAAMLRPFGLDRAGTQPTGAVQRFIRRTADLLLYTTGQVDPALPQAQRQQIGRQRPTLQRGLRTVVDSLRQQVQQAPPGGAGVTAQQAQDMENAILGIQGFNFQLGLQPRARVRDVAAANTAIAGNFYARLGRLRARFKSSSWVDIRGCRVGGSASYMRAVSEFFGTGADKPHVSAPDWWQSFPTLGYQTVLDRDIPGLAADADVARALDHWFQLTGVERRMMDDIIFYLDLVIREQERQRAGGFGLGRRGLLGGLHPPEELGLQPPSPLFRRPGLPRLELPELGTGAGGRAGGTPGFGQPRLDNPLIALGLDQAARLRAELTRIQNFTPEQKLAYYLDMALVLPVQNGGNPQDIRLYMKHSLRNRAIDNWLGSIWAERAPGLRALQRGAWSARAARRVEAVVDQDPQRNVTSMFVSPDTRYAQHIKSI